MDDGDKKPFGFDDEKKSGTNRTVAPTDCRTCGGDRFVLVRLRSPEQTLWMEEHKITPSTRSFHEEYAPCPDCHQVEIEYFRFDRTKFRVMDPATVRRTMNE